MRTKDELAILAKHDTRRSPLKNSFHVHSDPNTHRARNQYYACVVYLGIMRHSDLFARSYWDMYPFLIQLKRPLRGLSLRFSYSHLLFKLTLALPVLVVGAPGVAPELLSPKKLLLIGLPP